MEEKKERKYFPQWMVDRKYIEQDGVCANASCLNPLANGFHRHHSDSDHSNIKYENLKLLCIECHFATYAEHHEKYNPLEEHRKLQRTIIDKIGNAVEQAMVGKMTGSSLERVLAGFDRELSLSWKEKGLVNTIEYPSPTFVMLRHMQKSEIITNALIEGFKLGMMRESIDIDAISQKVFAQLKEKILGELRQ